MSFNKDKLRRKFDDLVELCSNDYIYTKQLTQQCIELLGKTTFCMDKYDLVKLKEIVERLKGE